MHPVHIDFTFTPVPLHSAVIKETAGLKKEIVSNFIKNVTKPLTVTFEVDPETGDAFPVALNGKALKRN